MQKSMRTEVIRVVLVGACLFFFDFLHYACWAIFRETDDMSSVPAHVWTNNTVKHILSPSILKFYFDNKIRRQKSNHENAITFQFGANLMRIELVTRQ